MNLKEHLAKHWQSYFWIWILTTLTWLGWVTALSEIFILSSVALIGALLAGVGLFVHLRRVTSRHAPLVWAHLAYTTYFVILMMWGTTSLTWQHRSLAVLSFTTFALLAFNFVVVTILAWFNTELQRYKKRAP